MESRGITPDRQKIDAKLHRLVDEFGVHVSEAERTVVNELAKEHSLTGMGTRSTDLREIRELVVGEWVTLQGKIVALMAAPSPAIAQTGVIADPSGAIRFVVWARANLPVMEAGKWYRLESAVVDEFRGV
ncbi:MAG: nucleotide-binding protein, partial [Methanomicrobiales archaeon]|nr:nucleotide-binding protein [Methanomicrobiales archaeon]